MQNQYGTFSICSEIQNIIFTVSLKLAQGEFRTNPN
eukprot:COSAG01_NODE_68481_length_264_cov_0.612121_1_plen_35_part_01